jgi:hypothetical protein
MLSGKRGHWPTADSLRHRRSIEGVEPFQQARGGNRLESNPAFRPIITP